MSLCKVKFNKVKGETRECKKCNKEFHTMRPIWVCKLCQNEIQKVIGARKRKERGFKDNYPFSTKNHEAGKRFCKIRQKLRDAWEKGPDAVKEHYQNQLREAEELGIMKWIYDRRDDETIKAQASKSKKQTQRDWPDTRGYYEE